MAMVKDVAGSVGVAVAAAVSAFILFIAFTGSFPLCCGVTNKEETF
jgi:hypothetical protein